MMPAKELARHALLALRKIDSLSPIGRQKVLQLAVAVDTPETSQLIVDIISQLDDFTPVERQEVLHVAGAIVAVEIARLNRPAPVRDE